jgi:hypothetical protein
MPPINEKKSEARGLKLASLPDRDNPLAWKAKTREGKRGARELLLSLTDEEITRYMGVALDQMRLEERLAAVKMLCAAGGVAVIGLLLWHGMQTRFDGWAFAGLGLGIGMVYWPWRVLKCRQLWQMHFEAARAEQLRRAAQGGATGP